MANTIILSENIIEISNIDTDWYWYQTLVGFAINKPAINIHSIQFIPGATNDRCVLKNGSSTSAIFFDRNAANVYDDEPIYYNGEEFKPFLDLSAGVYSANAKLIIILSRKGK